MAKEMNIQLEKIKLTKLLLNTDSPSILQAIKDVFTNAKSADFWDSLSEDQKSEIKTATTELETGASENYNEFISKHR